MDGQEEVIRFLEDGASFGKPGVKVARIETHISIVFLVDNRVYKLKRAVRFSYLDYSTVALREACCRKELALNRRTAPELYLGVHAITRDADGRLAVDGNGSAIDWIVAMRRFSDDALFDTLAKEGKLTLSLISELADRIAAFHEAEMPVHGQGGSAAMRDTIAGNRDNLLRHCPPLDGASAEALDAASLASLTRLGPLLDQRQGEGKVRRCHGDLHLRNVCLFEGRPTLFDCIEFNDTLACIDVLYDLAFLLMDLVHRGLAAHANLACNRYLDMTGDIGGLAALPLFMSVRAAVRAHVLASQDQGRDPGPSAAEARSYLALARAMLQEHRPVLIAVGGLSGTGKSSLARALASSIPPAPGARMIRSDVLRKRLAHVAPETRLPPDAYGAAASEQVYRAITEQAAAALAAGYSAIADATYLRAEERNAIAEVARRAGVPFHGLWLEASQQLLEQRIDARRHDASDADRSVLAFQKNLDTGRIDWHRVDTNGDIGDVCRRAREAIGSTNESDSGR